MNKVLNNQYNKTIYTALVGAFLTMVFTALKDYGIVVSVDLQVAITGFAMILTTFIAPNKTGGNQ